MADSSLGERLAALLAEKRLTPPELAAKVEGGTPTAGHIRKILAGDIRHPHAQTLRNLGEVFGDEELLLEYAAPRTATAEQDFITGIWYEHIPPQPRRGRPYESVDRVVVGRPRGVRRDRIAVTIDRVFSTRERGEDEDQHWEGVGVTCEERSAYIAFKNVSSRRADSNGALAVRRSHGNREVWHGYYLRFPEEDTGDPGGPAPWFRVDWYRDPSAVPTKKRWLPEGV